MKRLLPLALLLPLAACESTGDNRVSDLPLTPPQASFGSADDIADFNGARAGQAEGGLNARGYYYVRSRGLTGYWWNAATRTCAAIVTSNGRFSSVTTASPSECNS